MFSLLSVSLLSVGFFCARSCPCLGQAAVANVCCSLGWAAAPASPGQGTQGGEELERSHQCFPISPWTGKMGFWQLLPGSLISVILFLVSPQPLPSIWQWMTEEELILANQLFPGSCVLDLLPCWELWRRIYGRCVTPQVQKSILWNQYWEHAKGGSDWTIRGCQQRWCSFHPGRFSSPDWTTWPNLPGSWTCCEPEVGLEASWISSSLSYTAVNKAALLLQQLFTSGVQWEWKQCTSAEFSGGGWTVFARVKAAFIKGAIFAITLYFVFISELHGR